MLLSLAELMGALPRTDDACENDVLEPAVSVRTGPIPIGRWRRLHLLGMLPAQIFAAYLFYWLRGWLHDAERKEQLLVETHWRVALQLLDSMGYLRGAVMKVGQTLANFPDIVPQGFVETLESLHFSAPPMHWSLLREMVHGELGDDPDHIFASFNKRAFSAASLGQVHQATLPCGKKVAVKIQYPAIARSVQDDFRNLLLLLLPARLGGDWENIKNQLDDLRRRIERESNYLLEARTLIAARSLFRDDDGIVIPRVYRQHSTRRVLTMERLEGVHLPEFLVADPSQDVRDAYGRKIVRVCCRLLYAGRLLYGDVHPGNFIFMKDGRLGVIDFGFAMPMDEALWALFWKLEPAMAGGRREDRIAAVKLWNGIGDDPADADRLQLCDEFTEWIWQPRSQAVAFDFGNEGEFRRGIKIFLSMMSNRYTRAQPCTPTMARQEFGLRSMLYRLKSRVDVAAIVNEEAAAAGKSSAGGAATGQSLN